MCRQVYHQKGWNESTEYTFEGGVVVKRKDHLVAQGSQGILRFSPHVAPQGTQGSTLLARAQLPEIEKGHDPGIVQNILPSRSKSGLWQLGSN